MPKHFQKTTVLFYVDLYVIKTDYTKNGESFVLQKTNKIRREIEYLIDVCYITNLEHILTFNIKSDPLPMY